MRIPFTNIEIFSSKPQAAEVKNMADQQLPPEGVAEFRIPFELELTRSKQDILTWRQALIMAEHLRYPNRQELYRLYKDAVMDPQISACIQTRKNSVLGSSFCVRRNGEEVPELTAMIRKKWFYDFVDLCMDSIFWGYSLVQFGDLVSNEFRYAKLACERHYVKQEFELIVTTPSQITGYKYTELPLSAWCLGIGEKRDLGLLAKLSPLFLYKKQAMAAWSNYADLFGVPVRVGKLSKKDRETYQQMVSFLKNMGNSAYAVIGKEDDIEMIETGKSSGQDVFDKMIDRMNGEIAKLILGQSGTTDEKAFAGSAEVHERVLRLFQESDERFIENVFTHQLIPFLIEHHGFPLQGCTIEVEEDDELTLKEKSQIDIELLKTGLYVAPVDYLRNMYGTELELKPDPNQDGGVNNRLDEYYGKL